MELLQIVLSAGCGLVVLHLLWLIARNHRIVDPTLYALGVLEAGLVVQLVLGLVRVFGGAGDPGDLNVAAYVGYLVGALLVLPVGFLWAAAEQTRSGTAVLLVAVLAIPVLELRLQDLWATR